MNKILFKKYIMGTLLFLIGVMGLGCTLFSGFTHDSSVIAVVNGYNIDIDAFQKRISAVHTRKPMVQPEERAGAIDIREIVENMINDRLMVQESYRVELDETPLLQKQVDSYITTSSVIRLRKEEVQDKINVTEEELREYFDIYYEALKVRQIVVKDRKKAEEISKLLKNGADFIEIAKTQSEWGNEQGGDLGFINRGRMEKAFEEAAFALKEGEISDIVETGSGFHIIRVDERRPAAEKMFEEVKKRIERKLAKERATKRATEYVAELKSKTEIRIEKGLLYSLDPKAKDCDEHIVIARVRERPINTCDFIEEARRRLSYQGIRNGKDLEKINQEILDSLITYELVEQEALKRNYMNDSLFKKDVEEYKENLLVNFFKQEMILPRAIPTEKELEEYYEAHKDDFKKDYEVWFSEMIFSTHDAAEAILKELRQGADFSFLASKKSLATPRTGANVWIPLGRLSTAMREGIKELEVGGISEVIRDSRKYKIIKLKGKRGGAHEDFSRVRDKVRRIVTKIKFDKWLQQYTEELRNISSIAINKKVLNELTKKYTKEIASSE